MRKMLALNIFGHLDAAIDISPEARRDQKNLTPYQVIFEDEQQEFSYILVEVKVMQLSLWDHNSLWPTSNYSCAVA